MNELYEVDTTTWLISIGWGGYDSKWTRGILTMDSFGSLCLKTVGPFAITVIIKSDI